MRAPTEITAARGCTASRNARVDEVLDPWWGTTSASARRSWPLRTSHCSAPRSMSAGSSTRRSPIVTSSTSPRSFVESSARGRASSGGASTSMCTRGDTRMRSPIRPCAAHMIQARPETHRTSADRAPSPSWPESRDRCSRYPAPRHGRESAPGRGYQRRSRAPGFPRSVSSGRRSGRCRRAASSRTARRAAPRVHP